LELEKAFMKDLLEATKTKTCHHNHRYFIKEWSTSNLYYEFGNSREYYPLVKETDYFSKHVNGLISNFFNNSASQFASFFTTETNLSQTELEDLKKIIDSEILKRKNDRLSNQIDNYFIVLLAVYYFFWKKKNTRFQ
jgi:hypothetical protein